MELKFLSEINQVQESLSDEVKVLSEEVVQAQENLQDESCVVQRDK